MKYDEIINKKYGKLKVIGVAERGSRSKNLCLCDCGNKCTVRTYDLTSGKRTMCPKCSKSKPRLGRRIDYTGQKFGKLTVIKTFQKNGKSYCKCKCECENIKDILSASLKRGLTKSCGCLEAESRYHRDHVKDITGMKFGKLTVINKAYKKYDSQYWNCKCDCGREVVTDGRNLRRGKTKSCGCINESKQEKVVENILKDMNLDYIFQYRIDDCKNKFTLPFDFYIPSLNMCIEIQGELHYKSVEFFGGDERLKTYKNNDNIKKMFCKENGINLLEVFYYETKDEIINKLKLEKEKYILNPCNDHSLMSNH